MAFSSQVHPPSRWVHVNEVQAQGTVFKFSWISHSFTRWMLPCLPLCVRLVSGFWLTRVPPLVPVSPASPSPVSQEVTQQSV